MILTRENLAKIEQVSRFWFVLSLAFANVLCPAVTSGSPGLRGVVLREVNDTGRCNIGFMECKICEAPRLIPLHCWYKSMASRPTRWRLTELKPRDLTRRVESQLIGEASSQQSGLSVCGPKTSFHDASTARRFRVAQNRTSWQTRRPQSPGDH